MTYEQAVAYLETFVNYERKPQLEYGAAFKIERIREFLARLGNPQEGLKVIHVAGTKGKGSTACFIAHILCEEVGRVGLYTSPHLVDFRERIRVLDAKNTAQERVPFGGMILKTDFAALMTELKPQIVSFHQTSPHLGDLTFFEVLTALAFLHFKKEKVVWAVLETGLGGRLDATNVVGSCVCVITAISYDHQHILGQTLPEIAFEKAGIIKRANQKSRKGVGVCVAASQPREVAEVLRRRCRSEGAVLFEAEKDFTFKRLAANLMAQEFFYQGLNSRSHFLRTRMLGLHQLMNASVAVAACEALSLYGLDIGDDAITKGVWKAFLPGRLEVIRTQPFVILDGAHNRDAAIRLANFLEREFANARKWLVFGASQDKDAAGMITQLEAVADRVILTRADNPRAADPEQDLRPHFKKTKPMVTDSVEKALEILDREIKEDEVAVITGSLFVVGEAKSYFRGQKLWPSGRGDVWPSRDLHRGTPYRSLKYSAAKGTPGFSPGGAPLWQK